MEAISLDDLQGLIEIATTWSLRALGGIAILLIGIWLAKVAAAGVRRALARSRLDESLVDLLGRFAFYAIVSLVAISVLGIVGIETASLITVLGASSLAIGLALQGSLSNLASGVMLLLFRPLRAGDYVEVGDDEGWVAEVGVFSTALDTVNNVRVVLPNTHVADHPIRNWSTNGTRRVDLEIEVEVGADLPVVREAIAEVLRADSRVLEKPAPVVAASDFGDTSVNLVVRPWCEHQDYWGLRYSLPEQVKAAVERAGFSLPCPQRQLRLQPEVAG